MKQQIRHRLAWAALAVAVGVILFASGCSMLEEQMASAQAALGFAGDKEIIECTSNTETGCEGWVESEATTTN
jgi:hypothetical protein|tara:strand:+ start:261 stop:479 length:219 start_codon:yes stop_codon:yes gene_type:complete